MIERFAMFFRSAILAAALLLAAPAAATERLIFATASPPDSPVATRVFEDWVRRINADGTGVVRIDLRPGFTMANPGNFYDRVKDGVVPISWGIMTMVGGRFPLTSVVELPALTDDAETATTAFWRLYAEGLLDAEYHDIKPLFMASFPQSGIHLSRPIPSLDTLAGARVITGSQTIAAVVQALGGIPQSISPADAYQAISRGTVDGRLVPYTAFPPFRMDEITRFHIEAPFGTAMGMVFINRRVWQNLPERARETIMRHSGEAQSRRAGAFFDEQNREIRNALVARGTHTMVQPSEAQLASWRQRLEPVRTAWIERTPNGAAILARYTALLAQPRPN